MRILGHVIHGDHINVTEIAQELGILVDGVFCESLTLSVSEIGTTANWKIFLYQNAF